MHTQGIVVAMLRDAFLRRCGQWLLKHLQVDRLIAIEPPSRLGAGKTAVLVRQGFQPRAQAFTGIHVFLHQRVVAFDQAAVDARKCFLKSYDPFACFRQSCVDTYA